MEVPQSVPFAGDSVLRVAPVDDCKTPEEAGRLVGRLIDQTLETHPAILIKGLPIHSRADFSRVVGAVGLPLHDYMGGNAVRDSSVDNVAVSSLTPKEVTISPHNENCHMPHPPDIVMFCCLTPAESGGEVPINDVRKTLPLLPADFVEEMRARGMRIIRRVPKENDGLLIGWQQSFNTTKRAEVEAYLEQEGFDFAWRDDEGIEFWFKSFVLKTYRGEELWFNQLSESNAEYWLAHPAFEDLERQACQSDTAYGDTGELFPAEITAMVRGAIWRTTELVRMEPTDVIVLDNNLIQHGRMHYRGERHHLIAVMS